jgi:hypothetical protein
MRTLREILFTALGVVLAFGILGQQALAQDEAGTPQFRVTTIAHMEPASVDPTTAPALLPGIVAMGPNPAAAGDWPCFAGSTACSSIAAGGLVVGIPYQIWPLASADGQIYYTFSTTTASGTTHVAIKVTQGATTIYDAAGNIPGIAANSLYSISIDGVTFTGAVAGPAKIVARTKIGTSVVSSTTMIYLQ